MGKQMRERTSPSGSSRVPILFWRIAVALSLIAGPVGAQEVSPVDALPGEPVERQAAVSPRVQVPDDSVERAVGLELPRPPDGPVPARGELVAMVDRLAQGSGLEPSLVHALVSAESGYDPHAVSGAGAVGLMQILPETAAEYGVQSVESLFDPETNLRTGLRHLKRLLQKYGGLGQAVMAYNAGEGVLDRNGGFVDYPETQRFTHKVLSDYLRMKGIAPYSMQARIALGMALTPEMARAGEQALRDAQRRGAGALRGGRTVGTQPPASPQAGGQGRRLSRLSSRLGAAGDSLLESRLADPSRFPVGQRARPAPYMALDRRPGQMP